jgi:hypothetical protein
MSRNPVILSFIHHCQYPLELFLIVCRTISKYLVLCACEWYRKLKPYLDVLEPVGICWLPAGYLFPPDLKVWLGVTLLTDALKPRR